MEWDFGAVEHPQQIGLLLAQATQQLIEQREAGDAAEDAVEPGAHRRRPFWMGREPVDFQVGVEPYVDGPLLARCFAVF